MTMATGSIVKDLDVVEDVGTRHIPGFIDTFADSLFLQAAEKGFRHGVDTHGAEQSSYQVTDGEPGNARGTPESDRQVNAKAASPIPARVRSIRRSEAILD